MSYAVRLRDPDAKWIHSTVSRMLKQGKTRHQVVHALMSERPVDLDYVNWILSNYEFPMVEPSDQPVQPPAEVPFIEKLTKLLEKFA